MVLAMFVDADRASLLSDLAEGHLFIPPGIVDPAEPPPYSQQPIAEFAKGIFYFQQRLGSPRAAARLARRMAFHEAMGAAWKPAALSTAELAKAHELSIRRVWEADPTARPKRVDRGEAECAAVAVSRGWRLWSDDAAIVQLLGILHPGHPVERTGDLLARAVQEGLLSCSMAADLYNEVFKGGLGLWSRVAAVCERGVLVFRQP